MNSIVLRFHMPLEIPIPLLSEGENLVNQHDEVQVTQVFKSDVTEFIFNSLTLETLIYLSLI